MMDPSSSTTPSDADPYLDEGVFTFDYGSAPVRYIDAQYMTSSLYNSSTRQAM